MATAPIPPTIGQWFQFDSAELFEVVATDADDGTVELQHFDGTVEEMELTDWMTLSATGQITPADAPEDWHGSVDVDDAPEPREHWRSVT